ncbi:MAG: methyltransferase [Candidatus Competibacteraceae bacterium]|nr:methyltransferase [Candidatus Competibacteraceae bacterium]
MPVRPVATGSDLRSALLPVALLPLFDDRFIASCDLIEEYVFRLALKVARDAGLEEALARGGAAADIASRAGLDAAPGPPLVDWLLRLLVERGAVARNGGEPGRFQALGPLPDLDPAEIERAQAAHDPAALPSYRLAALAAEGYPQVMRGAATGEAVLFSADRISAWSDYFSNQNPLYAISNQIGSRAVLARFPHPRGTVLEIGGGAGSGAMALLDGFAAAGATERIEAYRFTELSPLFLRRGQRALMARPDAPGRLSCGLLDIDRPFAKAGVEPGSLSVVYGVNTLHVARDLAFTLAEIRAALAPGGCLIASECVRPFPGRTVYVEFVFALLDSFRAPVLQPQWRPNGGFLTPEQWLAAFRAAGFAEPFVWPDIPRIRERYPALVAAAVGAVKP